MPTIARTTTNSGWVVVHGYSLWFAYTPHTFLNAGSFRTWREAYDFARQEATR